MNGHQKVVVRVLDELMSEYIGGYENSMMDFAEDDEEYIEAKEFLSHPHEELINFFYDELMRSTTKVQTEARFCGKEWITERISNDLKKMGY